MLVGWTMTGRADTVVVHDAKRCPECDSLGKIVDRTVSSYRCRDRDRDMRSVRNRTYECYECGTEWEYYA